MDHGFVASIMRTPVVPPWDPWFAGGHLNVYYYYGSWIMGVLGLSTGVPSRLVFNLGLPTVLALAGVNCYMVGHLLLDRYRWLPVLPLILPNPASVVLAAQGIPLSKVAWDSTRVITDTINEYPLFSFTWGDLHAHVIGIFNQAFLIALLVLALRRWPELSERARLVLIGLVALSLGAMPGINSWDVLLYGPITLLVAGLIWLRHRHDADGGRITALHLLIAAPVLAIALYAPDHLSFASSGIKGVGLVTAPSDPVQFLLVYGFFLAIAYLACIPELRRRPYLVVAALPFLLAGYAAAAIAVVPLACLVTRLAARDNRGRPEDLLVALGLAIAIFCELVYLKDNMGDQYFRMNTVFKFYIGAWLLLGIGTFVMAGRFLDRPAITERVDRVPRAARRGIVIAVLALLLAAPFLAAGNVTHPTYTLDGTRVPRPRAPRGRGRDPVPAGDPRPPRDRRGTGERLLVRRPGLVVHGDAGRDRLDLPRVHVAERLRPGPGTDGRRPRGVRGPGPDHRRDGEGTGPTCSMSGTSSARLIASPSPGLEPVYDQGASRSTGARRHSGDRGRRPGLSSDWLAVLKLLRLLVVAGLVVYREAWRDRLDLPRICGATTTALSRC